MISASTTRPPRPVKVRVTPATSIPRSFVCSEGSLLGAWIIVAIAPFAGITPQVRRVSAGGVGSGAPSQPACPPAPLCVLLLCVGC